MDDPSLVVAPVAIIIVLMLYLAAWESGKKRKIGLTGVSFLTLFTPFIACIVSWFTGKIDKKTKYPTYEQRLQYENTPAMLFAAILFFVLGLLNFLVGLTQEGAMIYALMGRCVICIVWGSSLLTERNKLLSAKNMKQTKGTDSSESDATTIINIPVETSFVFDSNIQQRIGSDGKTSNPVYSYRKVIVEHSNGNEYKVSVINTENNQIIMNPVIMNKVSYSKIDECLKLISTDSNKEYGLNVFYKNGQVEKCVIYRKSKNVFIHYCKS